MPLLERNAMSLSRQNKPSAFNRLLKLQGIQSENREIPYFMNLPTKRNMKYNAFLVPPAIRLNETSKLYSQMSVLIDQWIAKEGGDDLPFTVAEPQRVVSHKIHAGGMCITETSFSFADEKTKKLINR